MVSLVLGMYTLSKLFLIVQTLILMHLPSACCFPDPFQSVYMQTSSYVYRSFISGLLPVKSIAVNKNVKVD